MTRSGSDFADKRPHAHYTLPDHNIRPFSSDRDYAACIELQEETWGAGFNERVPPGILRIAQRLGGVASGAFTHDGRLEGFVFGITGWREGVPVHWSDMLAVRPESRDRGVGESLKRHQRDVLMGRGVFDVEWTFDPLESRNAHLNFGRLGVVARRYVRDFYGASDSPLHTGLGTDRLVASWRLDDRRVEDRLAGRTPPPGLKEVIDLPVINPVTEVDGVVACEDVRPDIESDRLLITIPANIQQLQASYPAVAARWRAATREAFELYLGRGWEVVDLARADTFSAYLLDRIG